MKRIYTKVMILAAGMALGRLFDGVLLVADAGGGQGGGTERCVAKNGDVNADGKIDLTDAVTILGYLFLDSPTELAALCAAPGTLLGLPDTGQTKCYQLTGQEFDCVGLLPANCPFQGQDAQWPTGCPNDANRFTLGADDTVTDHCTGLEWQRFTADIDGDTRSTNSDATTWCAALNFCENSSLAGHDDWRLPNVRELESIVDYGPGTPHVNPLFRDTQSDYYWSSTSDSNGVSAFIVNFGLGSTLTGVKTGNHFVRAVRGGWRR